MLDDLGAEKTSEWVEETMNLIVNTRYNERRPTIFTTNYEDMPDDTELDSLQVRVGFRMHSRLHEMCEFLEYDGADYRDAAGQRRRRTTWSTLWKTRKRPPRAAGRARRPASARRQLRELERPRRPKTARAEVAGRQGRAAS